MRARRLTTTLATATAALAAVLAGAPAASAADCSRYAAPAGSDSAAGTAEAPLRTAQALADALKPGETGCLRAGTYSDEVDGPYVVRFGRSGASGAPVTLRSAPGERATLRGIVYVPQGTHHVTLADVAVDGRRASGEPVSIQVMGADVTVEDSDITNANRKSCMILGAEGWGRALRTVVRRNTFHHCGDPAHGMLDHGIYVNAADDTRIVDNVFADNAAFAVHLYPDARGTHVAHNVMVRNGGGVIFAGVGGLASSASTVEHNVIAGSTKRAALSSYFEEAVGQGNVARSNCLGDNAKGDVDLAGGGYVSQANVDADPRFVDASGGDFRVRDAACLRAVGYDTAATLRGAPPVASDPVTPAPPVATPPATAPQTQPQPQPAKVVTTKKPCKRKAGRCVTPRAKASTLRKAKARGGVKARSFKQRRTR